MSVLIQVLATAVVCFPCLNMGVIYAWPSSTVLVFTSPNTTLDRPMSELEMSLFGSMATMGAMIGTLLTAVLLDRYGRKFCSILSGLTSVVSWVIIASTTSVEAILAAVFIAGLSGASFLIVPVFVSEFCQESIRGTMTSGSMVFYGIGSLISYILGGCLSYKMMIYVAMTVATAEVAVMVWLKESPVYLLKNGMEEDAAKSIAFYRRVQMNSKTVKQELAILRRTLRPAVADSTAESHILQSENTDSTKKTYTENVPPQLNIWKFYKKSQPTQRGLVITMALMSSAIFQGLTVVQVYAEPLFTKAVPELSAWLCTVIFAVSIVVASVAAAYMSDVAGRRPLMTYSSIGSGVCCILLGTQIQFQYGPGWVTALVMNVFCVTYSFGGGTVPFVLLAEVFLPQVKSLMTMLVVEWMWICNSLILLIFHPLILTIGLGPIFYLFAAICFLSAAFSVFYVPETKGLPLDAVQQLVTQKTML